jgi:hypothetical protein
MVVVVMMMMMMIDVAIAADTDVAIQADRNVTQNEAETKLNSIIKSTLIFRPAQLGIFYYLLGHNRPSLGYQHSVLKRK